MVRRSRAVRRRRAHPRCMGRRRLERAASAFASPDENSRRRSAPMAADGTLAGAQAPHRALAAGRHGARPPRVRLARCLIHLLEGYGQRKAAPSCHVRVSQERLGTILSLSRQTVNELLRHLEQEGVIQCQRGGVRILDPRRLRDAAQAPS
ncbi:Crp/Fnr family transcriptional regulator [Bradyrhizobium sp. AZCC 2262]|uniref:Crp/Fnr family transcriptional regulator n=1 Tax=Bradyrhizobium sp. AZCC 2262 TaxID=3117022 RepID=UPI003FA5F308